MTKLPLIILEAAKLFANPATCQRLIRQARWPDDKPLCPVCNSDRIGLINGRKTLQCKTCRKQFSVRHGTVLEESPLELGQWLLGFFALYQYPAITCQQIADLLGVTLKTAWKMRQKLESVISGAKKPEHFKEALQKLFQNP